MALKAGTIVDAAIIQDPSSTKNREGKRDPAMRQVRKGKQYCFGMAHSMATTAANVLDVIQAGNLLHGGEKRVWGDAGYAGVGKREANQGLEVAWLVALKPGKRRLRERGGLSVRAKVEHPSGREANIRL